MKKNILINFNLKDFSNNFLDLKKILRFINTLIRLDEARCCGGNLDDEVANVSVQHKLDLYARVVALVVAK